MANLKSSLTLFHCLAHGNVKMKYFLDGLCDRLLFAQNLIENHKMEWKQDFCDNQTKYTEFCFFIFQCLHICWELVRNFKDIPQSTFADYPSFKTDVQSLCARSWIVFYYLIQQFHKNKNTVLSQNIIAETLIWGHEQLGLESLCCGDNGAFLQLIIHHVAKLETYYHYEIYQCFSCLFGTDITINTSQELANHDCPKSQFDLHAATIMYKFIRPVFQEKIETRNFRTISRDIKDCLDMISALLPEPPENST